MEYNDGLICFVSGCVLSATIIGAIVGIPLAIAGAVIMYVKREDADGENREGQPE